MATVNSVESGILSKFGAQKTGAGKANDTLGKDAFLNLLITQMRYQDPLEPTTNEDFLAQMAQFSSLEQMTNLNTSVQLTQANGLIDKYIVADTVDELTGKRTEVIGIVDGVMLKQGVPYLYVGDKEVALSDVSTVVSDFGSETVALIEAIKESGARIEEIEALLRKLLGEEEVEEGDIGDEITEEGDGTEDGNIEDIVG